jgi:hypothetical protein
VDDLRAGALERGGSRPRGVEPSSEADPARGGIKASSEAELARGSVEVSNEVDSARGSVYPRARRTPPEGAFIVPPCWAMGATRVVIVSRVCFRFMG